MAIAQIDAKQPRYRLDGFFRGQVVKHSSAGRCKIWIPSVYPEEAVANPDILPDAEQAAPLFGGASNGSGVFSYPRLNSIVWCFFQDGDQNYPVYFAAANAGPEGAAQYAAIGPEGGYEKYGKLHDNAVDYTDKVSEAAVHRINVSKSTISFTEDGGMTVASDHTNPVAAPGNVNLPYSTSHHMLNDLSSVIMPGKVKNAALILEKADSANYATTDVVSGLANAAFGISCEVEAPPSEVFREIDGKLGACCVKGYKTQCRPVYSKQCQREDEKDPEVPIYLAREIDGEEVPVDYHHEFFATACGGSEDAVASSSKVYVVSGCAGSKRTQAKIDGVSYKVGDKLRLLRDEVVRDITKAIVRKVDDEVPRCRVFIAAEDCEIDKWQYVKDSGYDIYLCSPHQFGNPVEYFDKPLDNDYPRQCPQKVWPPLVDPKVEAYKASVILIEDRRKHVETSLSKNGVHESMLSDSYEESWLKSSMSANGDWQLSAFKQDYDNWNKTRNYYKGEPVQANVSGYNVLRMGVVNDDAVEHGGRLSVWNYHVRKKAPKDSSEWWHYNSYANFDQHHGLSVLNDNLSITEKPQYWKSVVGEIDHWPRWTRCKPVEPTLREQMSCSYLLDMDKGTAKWALVHLEDFGSSYAFAKISADCSGKLSIHTTDEFGVFTHGKAMANHPSHDSGADCTYRLEDGQMVEIPNPHDSLPYQEPKVRNEWVRMSASPKGIGSIQATKTVAISCMDPYDQWKYSELSVKSDGTFGAMATNAMLLEARSTPGSPAVDTGCCAWPPDDVRPPSFLPQEARIDMRADSGTLTQQSYNAMTLSSLNGPMTIRCVNGQVVIDAAPGGVMINGDVFVNGKLETTDSISTKTSVVAATDVLAGKVSLTGHVHVCAGKGNASTAPVK